MRAVWQARQRIVKVFVQQPRVGVVEFARALMHARLEFEIRGPAAPRPARRRASAVSMWRDTNVSTS